MSLRPGLFGGRSQTQTSTVPFTSGSRRGRTHQPCGKVKTGFPLGRGEDASWLGGGAVVKVSI